jgi:hypothetical protein
MANSTGTLNGVYYVNKKNYDTINSGTAINGVTSGQDKIFIIKEELNTVVNATTATVCTDYTSASYTWSGNQPATTSAVWNAINQAAGATYSLVFDATNKKITLTPGKTTDNQGNAIASYPLLFSQGGDATVVVDATNSTVTICAASYSINTGTSDSVTLTRTAPGGGTTTFPLTINNINYAQNAGNSTKLSGNTGSYYTDANNLNAGTIPSARLSGTYTINVDAVDSVHADPAITSTNITNTYNKLVTGGAVYNFVTGKIASVYEYQGETT